ncbi:MAG: hypothetical protein ACFNPX_05290, partial [Neisseria subflava]
MANPNSEAGRAFMPDKHRQQKNVGHQCPTCGRYSRSQARGWRKSGKPRARQSRTPYARGSGNLFSGCLKGSLKNKHR